MKKLFLLSLLLIASACSTKPEKIELIAGYWNIDTVILADGTEREFPFSNNLDFFEINGTSGVKNRVSPTYDGKFVSYDNPIKFKWEEKDGILLLQFADGEQRYTQKVLKSSEDILILQHENGTEYHYKAFENENK